MERKSRPKTDIVLLAGPTASGKTRLALHHATSCGGWVVNADSMQVYRDLRILTARPTAEEEALAPHRLYGHIDGAERYSVGAWLAEIAAVLAEANKERTPVIIVGGTGLYFKALTEGLAEMPSIPAELRAQVLADNAGLTAPEMHQRLSLVDPEDAAHIRPSDRTRIIRALEVMAATGQSLASWQRRAVQRPLIAPGEARRFVLIAEKDLLARRISARTETMLANKGIAEASALLSRRLPADNPIMKAIGVRQVLDHLEGRLARAELAAAINVETRHYAKRQMTWFRNQMGGWERLDATLDLPRLPA